MSGSDDTVKAPEEAVEAGWAYVEENAEGPWSRTTFAAALNAAWSVVEGEE